MNPKAQEIAFRLLFREWLHRPIGKNLHTGPHTAEKGGEMSEEVLPCDLPCPKCGSTDVSRRFYAKHEQVPNETYNKCRNKYAGGQGHFYTAYREHLSHDCRCCQHQWQTTSLKRPAKTTGTRKG